MKEKLKRQVLGKRKVAVALTVRTFSTAMAANGQNFILGKINNAATAITGLSSNITGPALRIVNPSAAASATALTL